MIGVLHELKTAARAIATRPAFSALVIGVLAAGLACVIFMLVMVNAFVVRPLPFAAPEQLLHAGIADNHGSDSLDDVAGRDLIQLRRQLEGSAEVAGFEQATVNLSDLDRPERFDGAKVSANLWRVFGVAPMLGRDFAADDEHPGSAAVVMLSWDLWQHRYGGDRAIVGRQVRVNAQPATVIGVMPADFSYPYKEVVWIPASLSEATPASDDDAYTVVIRRHANIENAAITAALDTWFAGAARAEPDRFRGLHMGIEPLSYLTVSRTTRAVLDVMLAAVALVLLVACANAANLLLTRTLGRGQELAVRVALGASRARLTLHLLMQSLLLSLIATLIALLLAKIGVAWQHAQWHAATNGPPHWLRFDMDPIVIAQVVGVALLTALATGLLPAWRAGGEALAGNLRDGTRSVAGGPFARISRILVVGEIVLSCALLISVGTMVRGIAALDRIDVGIDSSHLLTARLGLFANTYPTGADQLRLYERLTDRLRADAGVVDASASTLLPLRYSSGLDVLPEGTPFDGGPLPQVRQGAVDDHFLSAYGVRLLRGRFFDDRDHADGERVAVVDQHFADRYKAGGDVIGRRFRTDPRQADGPVVTVIGVIAPLRLNSPGAEPQPALLTSLRQAPARFVSLAVRTRSEPAAFAQHLTELMRQVDPDTPLYWVRDYAAVVRDVTFGERVVAQLFGIFGVIALALAGAGLYGVVAFNVSQRTREIGVRRALGEPNASVLRNVFARTGWQLGVGLALGLAAGIPFTRLLTRSLPAIAASDPMAIVSALLVLIIAAFLAVILPARRALHVDPMIALRHE
ncbi:ADOP family duplicated permease [Dokdonella soli]|uniref:ABC transporter permease n=1 Tax=Dokdonella soli TaxID=529810 RepID=A0ABN1IR96_9GAMM